MFHLLFEFIAFLFAIGTFRKLDNFSKFIAIQVFIAFLVETIGLQMTNQNIRNIWLYNCYMPVEFSILFMTSVFGYKKRLIQGMVLLLLIYWLFWFAEIYFQSIQNFAVKTYVLGAVILLVSYALVLYKSAKSRSPLFRQSQFWFAIGIILFYGCNIPFFSMHNYIAKNSNPNQINMLVSLMVIFAHIRYSFIAIGFFVAYKVEQKKKIPLKYG